MSLEIHRISQNSSSCQLCQIFEGSCHNAPLAFPPKDTCEFFSCRLDSFHSSPLWVTSLLQFLVELSCAQPKCEGMWGSPGASHAWTSASDLSFPSRDSWHTCNLGDSGKHKPTGLWSLQDCFLYYFRVLQNLKPIFRFYSPNILMPYFNII
jgi:hypothetical protein